MPKPPSDFYEQFCDALEAKDGQKMEGILRDHPELLAQVEFADGIWFAINSSFPEAIPRFLEFGLHPDLGAPRVHQTLLQLVVCRNDLELVKLCLQHGANLEARNCQGETALGYATSWSTLEIVQALVDAGADLNAIEGAAENEFSTALDSACSSLNPAHDRSHVFALLRKHGAKKYSELFPAGQ
jgi:hypothetical protein